MGQAVPGHVDGVPAGVLDDHGLAEDAAHAWWALTSACHHRLYEIGPSRKELSKDTSMSSSASSAGARIAPTTSSDTSVGR